MKIDFVLNIRTVRAFFITIILLNSLNLLGQQIVLKGTVKDSLQNPLSYANVIAKPKDKTKNLQFFATDDNGFYRLIFQKGDSVTISISYLGYQSINYNFVALNSTTKNFIMSPSTEKLDEVVIEMPIVVKGDTTIYNTGKFVTGEERKLKNVLNKLPGVEVDKDGNVSVQGKKVTKMLVEGKKFFGGNTKLAVDNIPADAVDKVQVIDNYNEVAFLKSLSDSDEMAMNIQLKEDKKRFVFGDVEAGKGNDEFYKAHTNLFYYSPATNLNFIGNVNNIAEKTFTFKDYLNFQGGVNAVFGNNFNWRGGDFSQFLENRDVLESTQRFAALNITKATSQKLDVSGYLILNDIDEENFFQIQNDYSTFNEFRENKTFSDNLLGIGKLNIEYRPNSTERWYFRSQIKRTINNLDNEIISTISNETNTIQTQRNLKNLNLNQNVEWHKRVSDEHTFSTVINYNYINGNRNSFWQTEDNILQGLIPLIDNQQLIRLFQSIDRKRHNFDVITKHFWEINDYNHIYTTIGNKLLSEGFSTNDRQELDDGNINDFNTNGFGNDLTFNLNDFFLGLHYKYKSGIFTLKQGLELHNYSWTANQINVIKKNKWLLLPDFSAKVEFNKAKKIQFNYKLSTSFSSARKFANRFYLQSYNSVFRGNDQLENNIFHNLTLYYSRFSLYRGVILNLSANYNKQFRGVRNDVQFEGVNQFFTPRLFDDPLENVSFRGNISKKINKMRYKFKGTANFSKFIQVIDNISQQNRNNNYSYSFGLETLFNSFPNFEVGFKQSIGKFISSENTSDFITNEPFITIEYDFLKSFIFSFEYNLYDYQNRALNQRNRFDIANINLSYRKKDSPWQYTIFSNNLFNTEFKRNSSFSQFLISDTKTFILPRVLMFSVAYNL